MPSDNNGGGGKFASRLAVGPERSQALGFWLLVIASNLWNLCISDLASSSSNGVRLGHTNDGNGWNRVLPGHVMHRQQTSKTITMPCRSDECV